MVKKLRMLHKLQMNKKKLPSHKALAAAVSMALFYAVITILGARTYTALPQ